MYNTIYDLQLQRVKDALSNPALSKNYLYILDIAKDQLCSKSAYDLLFKEYGLIRTTNTSALTKKL